MKKEKETALGNRDEKEKARELTQAEQKRLAAFEELSASMLSQGYRRSELTVGIVKANIFAVVLLLPLLAVGTLDVLVAGVIGAPRLRGSGGIAPQSVEDSIEHGNNRWIVPMLDARRMEVYTAVYTLDGKRITPIESHVVTAESFAAQRAEGKVLFIGDGALKCREVLGNDGIFVDAQPLARNMVPLAFEAFEAGKFEDVAYFEPFYLKDFVATVSKKQLW